ncbi:MAG: hypothetical protein E7337_03710 [Clostridiales bacterium]|nr:hypothetical protein [Clostridiales bacterium]
MGKKHIRIGICVEDPVYLEQLREKASAIADRHMIKYRVDYLSGEAAIALYCQYDFLLVDIASRVLSASQLRELLNMQIEGTTIVFFSSERQEDARRDIPGVLTGCIKISSKGIEKILALCNKSEKEKMRIVLPTKRGIRKCCISDIIYAETWDRGVKLTLTNGQEQVRFGISKLKALLSEEQFIMCHRAYLVNMEFVLYVRRCELELISGEVIPVSKHRMHDVRKKLMRYSNNR